MLRGGRRRLNLKDKSFWTFRRPGWYPRVIGRWLVAFYTTLVQDRPAATGRLKDVASRNLVKTAAVLMLLMVGLGPANAFDLRDLLPCRAAAMRLCDRSQGLTRDALWKCGATLAARSAEVGRRCVAVLVRYGQLAGDSASAEKPPVP